MKPTQIILTFAVLCSAIALGGPVCATGTLASYEALGVGGCTIGTNTVFSFVNVSGTTGATEFDPSLVTVVPVGGSNNPELDFSVSAAATTGQLLETIFTYQVSGNTFTQSMITLSNSSEPGGGGVTDIQNLCDGGTFGPDGVTGCTGTPGSLLTLDGIQNTDQTTLTSVHISVTDDFTIDGTSGSASGGTFQDQFTTTAATPEPNTTFLLGAFILIGAAAWKRRGSYKISQ